MQNNDPSENVIDSNISIQFEFIDYTEEKVKKMFPDSPYTYYI